MELNKEEIKNLCLMMHSNDIKTKTLAKDIFVESITAIIAYLANNVIISKQEQVNCNNILSMLMTNPMMLFFMAGFLLGKILISET